jgi:hypothetical protein
MKKQSNDDRATPAGREKENYLRTAEMSSEDDYGMIDGIINNGPRTVEKKGIAENLAKMKEQCDASRDASREEADKAARNGDRAERGM